MSHAQAESELRPQAVFSGTVKEIRHHIPLYKKDKVVAVIETHNNPNLPEGASPIAWFPVHKSIGEGMEVTIARFEQPVGEKGGSHTYWEVSQDKPQRSA